MADLTLNEFKSFPEAKTKEILYEEKIKLYGRDFTEEKIPAQKISLFKKVLLKLSEFRIS